MALLLLAQPFAQRLHQLLEAEGLQLRLFLGREIALGHPAQPFLGNFDLVDRLAQRDDPLEGGGEDDVELVEIALVLDQQRARQVIEMLHRPVGEALFERLHQHEIFARGDRQMRLAQRGEEGEEHGAIKPDRAAGAKEKIRRHYP